VTSVADGSATITATSGSLTATSAITVSQVAASVEVTPTSKTLTSIGDTVTLVATVKDGGGTAMSGDAVTWTTSDAAVATVSSAGLVTSVADGSATITATSGSATKTATITVSQAAASLTLSPTSKTFTSFGDTVTLVATVKDAGGTAMTGAAVTWTSSNASVATVSNAGLVTSVADGSATITATSGSATATAAVTIAQVAASLGLSESSVSLTSPGDTAQLVATVKDAIGTTMSGATVTWASSNTNYATVSAGLVTSVLDGTVTITATSGSVNNTATAVVTCSTDTDSDRLYNCVETNTGTYVSTSNTGTSPTNSDTDGDAISDGDEILGTLGGLDLPGLGANPLKKTLLVEYDWFDDSGHSHRPTAQVMDSLVVAYNREGVQLINDYGQGSAPFDGGNLINDADGNVDGFGSEFYAYKSANFASNRNGYFHYAMHPHSYNNGTSSGYAQTPGDDLINATLSFYNDYQKVAGTIMHELGHNLGLRHGGDEAQAYKPNYNSVMNYQYQFSGVDTNCTIPGNGLLNYSHGTRPDLNEFDLHESLGICEDTAPVNALWAVDWNYDGDFVDNLATNVDGMWSNSDLSTFCQDNGNYCVIDTESIYNNGGSLLTDHNDWANLVYTGISDSDGFNANPLIIAEDPIEDILRQISAPEIPSDLSFMQIQIPTGRPPGK
jgi:uncharacterized protein YjdB